MSERINILRAICEAHPDRPDTQTYDVSLGALRELFSVNAALVANVRDKEAVIKVLAAEISMSRDLVLRRPA
jgi:hypothetical protein